MMVTHPNPWQSTHINELERQVVVLRELLQKAEKDAEKWLLVKPFVEVAPSMLDNFLWTYRMKPTALVGQDMEFTTWINKLSDASEAIDVAMKEGE